MACSLGLETALTLTEESSHMLLWSLSLPCWIQTISVELWELVKNSILNTIGTVAPAYLDKGQKKRQD